MAAIATVTTRAAAAAALLGFCLASASAGPLDEMAVERWAKLKEAERYQLNVAERLYREQQWKVAADEYEKFLKLYEKSEGAAYAQLKWSHCQIELRKFNAAVKDGYQSVLDYFPESPEAPIAALLIGRTHRNSGDTKLAKKAYMKAVGAYPKHFAAVMARLDLVDLAAKDNDLATQTAILRELTYDVERKGATVAPCTAAAHQYARLALRAGNFEDGIKATATTCKDDDVPAHLMHPSLVGLPAVVNELTGSTDAPTKAKGEKLADAAAGWLKVFATTNVKDEKAKPKAVAAWLAAAEVRRQARQPDKQKAVYEEMIAALGADDPTLAYLAQWYKENKQPELARATYARYKDAAEGQGQVANSFFEEKQYDKAVELYRRLAIGDPKTAPRWLGGAAWVYRNAGKPDLAIAVYRELLIADATKASGYHLAIADTLYNAGRWKDCIAAYRGTDNFPTNYYHMARAFRELKQYDEAIGLYRQVIAASPPSAPTALLEIARTNESAGKKEEAIKVFKQVCDKYPTSGEGSQAHARLNEFYKIPVTLGGAKN